ncbi:TorF family putative porin [Qipengyuania sp. CAU 1752]
MLTSFRGLAATLLVGTVLVASPTLAAETAAEPNTPGIPASQPSIDEEAVPIPVLVDIRRESFIPTAGGTSDVGGESGLELSGNVAVVSDYRFRGVSLSDGDIALQGGIDLGHSSGLYAGTWASSISGGSDFGELELDIYAGWSGDVSDGVTLDVGLLYYIYPTGDAPGVDTDYFEPYASIGTTLGPVGATVGVAYAWEQDSLGGGDNLYLYTDFELGIPQTPITLTAHLGYTDGVFATALDGDSFDWGIGASYAITGNLSLGLNYVDTQGPSIEDFTDAGFFASITYSM